MTGGGRHPGGPGLPQWLGATTAFRRAGTAGARVRVTGAAHPGRQWRPGFRRHHPAFGHHPLRHDHQGPLQRPAHRCCYCPHPCRGGSDHPITKHRAVGYWKGGDVAVEEALYQPQHIEKIVAWGGLASVKHVTRYIQPGLELIALDPKRSATIIGAEAFSDEDHPAPGRASGRHRLGVANQEGCANARVIYTLSGTDEPDWRRNKRELIYS